MAVNAAHRSRGWSARVIGGTGARLNEIGMSGEKCKPCSLFEGKETTRC